MRFFRDSTSTISLPVPLFLTSLGMALPNAAATLYPNLAKFYTEVKELISSRQLVDFRGQPAHISLRSLCRALSVAAQNLCAHPLRSLYEAFSLWYLLIILFLILHFSAVFSLFYRHSLSIIFFTS